MSNDSIKTVSEFVQKIESLGKRLLFRGLANSSWEVESSARRRIKASGSVFQNYNQQLLDKAKRQGFHRQENKELSDLELLAQLQHNGAATCLIDFTSSPFIALWFACQKVKGPDQKDGRVVALATDNIKRFFSIPYEYLKEEIGKFLTGEKIWRFDPPKLINRIISQQSTFILGQAKIDNIHYESIIIDKESKETILRELEERFALSEESLFDDFVGFSISNGCDRPYKEYGADDLLYLALNSYKEKDYEKAKEYCGDVLEEMANKDNSIKERAYVLRGAVKGQSGDNSGAIEDCDKAIAINKNNTLTYVNRGAAKGQLGDNRGAIEDYNQAISIDTNNALAYANRGAAKSNMGDNRGAIEDYNQAIAIDKNNALAYANRGAAKSNMGDNRGAIEDYNQAIAIDKNNALAYANRGAAKGQSGDNRGAIEDCDKAIAIDKNNALAYANRGIAKSNMGDNRGAIEDYNQAIFIDKNNALTYANRGAAKKQLGDHRGAEEDYNRAKEMDPNLDLTPKKRTSDQSSPPVS